MQEEKKQHILEAALKVVAEKKISGTRMHLIAKEAKVSQSILHYYFESKEDLLKSLLEYISDKFIERRSELINLENKTFGESLKMYFDQKKDLIRNEKEIDYAQFDYWVWGTGDETIKGNMQVFFTSWRDAISKSLEQAVIKEGKKPEYIKILPYIVVSTIMGASLQYLIDEDSFDLDDYFNVVEKMVLKFID